MSWCGSLWVHLVWDLLCFLYLISVSLFRFGKFSAIISSTTLSILFLLPFWNTYYASVGTFCIIS